MELTGKQKAALRSLAHHIKPVVLVGGGGLSESVVEKVKFELENHELIKVRVSKDAPVALKDAAADLHELTGAAVVQTIGRMVVLYLGRKKEPGIKLPAN